MRSCIIILSGRGTGARCRGGEDPEGEDTYATAITAAGDYALVSINGNQEVVVFDPATGGEVNRFEVGLPLVNYDGYITVIESGVTPVDLWAR